MLSHSRGRRPLPQEIGGGVFVIVMGRRPAGENGRGSTGGGEGAYVEPRIDGGLDKRAIP